MTTEQKLEKAVAIIDRFLDKHEAFPDRESAYQFFELTGRHMERTDYGWEPGGYNDPADVHEAVNAPV